MLEQRSAVSHRRSERLALRGLRLGLAVASSAIGLAFLSPPRSAEDAGFAGLPAGPRALLGAAHLAGGLAMLSPRLAARAATSMGILLALTPLGLLPEGAGVARFGPASMAVGVFLLAGGLGLRRRDDEGRWNDLLVRYADGQDAGRPRDA